MTGKVWRVTKVQFGKVLTGKVWQDTKVQFGKVCGEKFVSDESLFRMEKFVSDEICVPTMGTSVGKK